MNLFKTKMMMKKNNSKKSKKKKSQNKNSNNNHNYSKCSMHHLIKLNYNLNLMIHLMKRLKQSRVSNSKK